MIELISALDQYDQKDTPSLGYVIRRLNELGYIMVVREDCLVLRFDGDRAEEDERVGHLCEILAIDIPEFNIDDILVDSPNQQSMNDLPPYGDEEDDDG